MVGITGDVSAVRNVAMLCFSYQSILLPLFSFFNAGMSFGECYIRAKELTETERAPQKDFCLCGI